MAHSSIVPAELAYANDGVPYSPAFDDIYHSASGGLAQSRHVFLAGNDLPERWHGRDRFTILETGFGTGLNFLATWQAWREDPDRPQRLHFVSVEKHPFRRDDLAHILAAWPELGELSAALLARWPVLVPGLHRLHFEGGAVTLTLAFGDVAELLPQLSLTADAIYLDGFAPSKNPQMWSDEVFAALARLAAPGATLASWSVFEEMMFRLSRAGFRLEKRPGFGTKRYMLAGRQRGTPSAARIEDRRVAVVGAGIAGASAAHRLAAQGFEPTVIEAADEPAQGASGNVAGVFRPLPSQDDNRLSRLLRAGFLYGRRHAEAVPGFRHDFCGVLHLARDARHEAAQRRTMELQAPPPEFCRFVEREEAARLADWPVEAGGWWFQLGGWIDPRAACRANIANIPGRFGARVERMERRNGLWRLLDAEGELLAEAPQVVLANAADARRLGPELPVRIGRGMVTHLPEGVVPPFGIVATRLGYVTPAIDGVHCAGATLSPDDADPIPRAQDAVENLTRLDMILPGYAKGISPESLGGRVGFRPMSPDRLPIVGPVRASDGLYAINGFGARGLVWAALFAELLASQLAGAPLPLEADLAAAVNPSRFGADGGRRAR